MDIFNDDLDIVEIVEFGYPKRVYTRRNHFEDMDDLTFFRRFRLYKDSVLYLLEQIEGDLEFVNDRNNSVSPINQLLCTLRFYASSGHLSSVGDFIDMDPSTASRIVARVSRAIARLFPTYVKIPEGQNTIHMQELFYNIGRFPRVIGLVDGTHIKIQSPGGDDPEVFRNQKSFFSWNVQVVGGADLKFQDVIARWPGSAHDATVFANCNLRARFENNEFPNCVLLGDSGYPLRNYFLTPLPNPVDPAQPLYNESHIRTRNLIERLIGIWKRRFPILAYGCRLTSDTTKSVIVATTVLHNIARQMNEPDPPIPDDLDENELNYLIETAEINIDIEYANVNHAQNEMIQYFSTLR